MLTKEQVNKIIDEHQYCHRIDMAPLEYEEVLAISKGEMADFKVYEDDGLDDGANFWSDSSDKYVWKDIFSKIWDNVDTMNLEA
jgi:hypothetical protein